MGHMCLLFDVSLSVAVALLSFLPGTRPCGNQLSPIGHREFAHVAYGLYSHKELSVSRFIFLPCTYRCGRYTLCMPFLWWSQRTWFCTSSIRTLVILLGGGFFPSAFALRLLGADCELATVSNDSEVITTAPLMTKPMHVLGAIGEDIWSSACEFADAKQCGRLLIVADIRKEAVQRMYKLDGTRPLTRSEIVESCVSLQRKAKQSSYGSMGIACISDPLSEKNLDAVSSWLHCTPFCMEYRNFAPMRGSAWLWCAGDVSWPEGTEVSQEPSVQ